VRGSRRPRFTGSALIRLLVQLTEADVDESRQAFSERLSHWLAWTDAISLAAALNEAPAVRPGSGASASVASASASAGERDALRVRRALAKAIADPLAFAPDTSETDFASHRRRHVAAQQAMDTGIAPLRGRVRQRLAAAGADMARLAALDEVMQAVVGAQERALLSTVPRLLEKRFQRLRQAHEAPAEPPLPDTPPAVGPALWLDTFRRDMQAVLLAELDIRMQPVEGLLAALRAKEPVRHE